MPFFAHSYTFIRNMNHGGLGPADLIAFAQQQGLRGVNLHINDGGPRALSEMSAAELELFQEFLQGSGVALHLEISSTQRETVDRAAEIAGALGVNTIRLYARHHGPLSQVLARIHEDLSYACERAAALDLWFDYEQHEDLRAAEIVGILERIGDRRLNVLFDYANSLNAYEEPLDALAILGPYIRQVHVKGARKTYEGGGWGQLGVQQGGPEDEMPNAELLMRLLLLGEARPQVICFALEQEAGYHAPPLRFPGEPADPVIAHREPSETPLDPDRGLDDLLAEERAMALDQVRYNQALVRELRDAAERALEAPQNPGPGLGLP